MRHTSSFTCMVVGVYVATYVQERAKLWEDIITLKFAFKLPMVVLCDFKKPSIFMSEVAATLITQVQLLSIDSYLIVN